MYMADHRLTSTLFLVTYKLGITNNNRGWHAEWFTIGNHMKFLLARLGRQPNIKLSNWEEAPTNQEPAKVVALMIEIDNLKKNVLIAQAVVINFIYRNI